MLAGLLQQFYEQPGKGWDETGTVDLEQLAQRIDQPMQQNHHLRLEIGAVPAEMSRKQKQSYRRFGRFNVVINHHAATAEGGKP